MNDKRNFWVAGGDMRQVHLAQLLAQDGHTVHTYALEQGEHAAPDARSEHTLSGIESAHCVILPLPVCTTPGLLSTPLSKYQCPLTSISTLLSPAQVVCGGRLDPDTRSELSRQGVTVHDYFQREELAIANAVPTAEGAIQIAMEELPITIHGARVLILGYGRVGRATAQRFAALGAEVTAAARSYEQLAWARASDLDAQPLNHLCDLLKDRDLVINTIPSRLLGQTELSCLSRETLIIDLASRPGGVDMDGAARLGRRVIWALSLPGKVAPVTAGACIRDTVYNILHQAET